MSRKNALYAQSGGVTAVINATAAGVISECRLNPDRIGTVFAARNGILGALREELVDTAAYTDEQIAALRHTPGGAFGSCRFKLKGLEENQAEYRRLIEVLAAHDIGYLFYNGGGDSADTAYKVSKIGDELDYPVVCVGVPKTIDNDLPVTDCCPGFGSVAKYVAVSMMEASLDVESMAETSTKVFVMEVMGRHAGWIAAAGGLAGNGPDEPPQIILFPEVPFDQEAFLARVRQSVEQTGYCSIVVSEGVRWPDGRFLADSGVKDAFGHAQLGGCAPVVAGIVKAELGYKYHWAVLDYLQRSARHLASAVDLEQATAVGQEAVRLALAGKNSVIPVIERLADKPYRWKVSEAQLADMANVEKMMPRSFITENGFGITEECRRYLEPLIEGEAYPPYAAGLPQYIRLPLTLIDQKLDAFAP